MGEHDAWFAEVDEYAYGYCKSCGWRTGWLRTADARKAAEDHMAGLPV
jgi:hypothetical protein